MSAIQCQGERFIGLGCTHDAGCCPRASFLLRLDFFTWNTSPSPSYSPSDISYCPSAALRHLTSSAPKLNLDFDFSRVFSLFFSFVASKLGDSTSSTSAVWPPSAALSVTSGVARRERCVLFVRDFLNTTGASAMDREAADRRVEVDKQLAEGLRAPPRSSHVRTR